MRWWAIEFAKADKPIWMYDWQLFSKKLMDMFDPGDCEANVGKRTAKLKQNRLAAKLLHPFHGSRDRDFVEQIRAYLSLQSQAQRAHPQCSGYA